MISALHEWTLSLAEAGALQKRLAATLQFPLKEADFRYVAGADVTFDASTNLQIAAVVLYDIQKGSIIEESHAQDMARFPYVPGYLSFREAPVVLAAWESLSLRPQALILDGQGLAHPRRFGLACHIGLWLGIPTLGCAKSRLLGEYEEPETEMGSWSTLTDRGEEIGAVLRTRRGVKPVFISQGNLLPLPLCIELTLRCCTRFRLPEPTRQAHLLVTRLRKQKTTFQRR